MATNYGKTGENENYGGMCRIYVDLYRDLLWAVFIDKVPIHLLVRELAKILQNARTFKCFHHQFKRLLDVYASTGTIKNTDCDISVIYSLFRNIPTTLVPPTQGWVNIPQSGDFLVTDDLERIHHGRNALIGHAGEASITDADFTAQLSDIKNILTRLDRHLGSSYLPHLLQIESDCQSSKGHLNHYDQYIKELKRQQDAEADLRALVEENKQAIRKASSQFDNKVGELDKKLTALDTNIAAHDTNIASHDTSIAAHDTSIAAHDTCIAAHDTSIAAHDTNIAAHDTSIAAHDTSIAAHDTNIAAHDTHISALDTRITSCDTKTAAGETQIAAHDTSIAAHDTCIAAHDTSIAAHDTNIAAHDTSIAAHDTSIAAHDTNIAAHDTQISALDTRITSCDTKTAAGETQIAAHDTRIAACDTKLDEHDTKFGDFKTKMDEQEQIYSRVQHTLKEHRQERDEDMRIVTAVKRRQEEESQEKQKRAKLLSAGQDTLKNYLLKLYGDKILQTEPNLWFSMKDVLQMVVPLDIREDLERWMALSREDRKKERTSKTREGTKIKSKKEMFFKGLKRQYEIYLLGEAGVGKSTFCHQLINNWCKVQDTEPNDDYLLELKAFQFLFFIQARHAQKAQSVYEMIQTQNCPLKFRSILEKVFTSHPENCLVLIDGLDEWQSGTRGYQELPNVTDIEGSTILITSRQWRIEALDCDLPSSCRVLEIQGLDSYGIENLAGKALEAFTREDHQCSDSESLVKPFLDQMYELKLDNLAKIPLILLILIRAWLDGNRKLENACGCIYSGLIESLLIHSDKKVELPNTWGDRTKSNTLPTCFSERVNCLHYNLLLNELARMAFDHLFSSEKENTLVIRKHDLAKQPKVEEHLQMCLKLGLLIESKDFSETNECHRAFGFPHKTIQEFLCAVYLSGEEFETGFAKFCERVTSSAEVFENENVIMFITGMNITHCKKLFDYSCGIVFGRKYANQQLYPTGWYMRDMIQKIEKLAELCTAEARHSVPEGSHTVESQFVIPDMVVDKDTPEHNVEQFCRLGLNIKSLVYECNVITSTVTPFSVVESIRTMQHIQKLGIGCTAEITEIYIVWLCTYLSNLHQLKSFCFSVKDDRVRLPIYASKELVSKLGTLPNLVSVYLSRLDLSDINTCNFTSHLTSLGLQYTKSLSPGVMSGLCNQLHRLNMWSFYLSPAAVHQLRQYLMTSSSLQYLSLFLRDIITPSSPPYTVFDDMLDLTSHTSLHTLRLLYIDLKSGVRIHPGHNWREISMHQVYMSESMWQEFIQNLPTKPLQQLSVLLTSVKSLNTQTMSYIRDTFCVTKDSTDSTDSDSTHSDSTHSDSTHIDSTHSDSTHSDSTHSDSTHSDSTVSDSTHSDSTHSDSTHSDIRIIVFNTKH